MQSSALVFLSSFSFASWRPGGFTRYRLSSQGTSSFLVLTAVYWHISPRNNRLESGAELRRGKPEGKWLVGRTASRTTGADPAMSPLPTFSVRLPISKLSASSIHLLPITTSYAWAVMASNNWAPTRYGWKMAIKSDRKTLSSHFQHSLTVFV